MAQIFSPGADIWLRVAMIAVASVVVGLLLVGGGVVRSDYMTRQNVVREQPVPFSHQHHVAGLGLDCRYCHTSVEQSATAGFPPTHTCMTCHSQIWTDAPVLEPVRQSLATGTPLRWTWVNKLPQFVYFNHSIHVSKGVGCVTCHGQVDTMPLMRRGQPLLMQWCLDCHRNPAPNLRPREAVFDMTWTPPADREAFGKALVERYHIDVGNLTHCYICHR